MKFNKSSKCEILSLLGGVVAFPIVLGSCQIPPVEVLRGIQRETLVGYFAKDRVERGYEHGEWPGSRPLTSVGGATPVSAPMVTTARRDTARADCVISPFTSESLLVDVSFLRPGELAICPYTGKRFYVPAATGAREDLVYTAPDSVPRRVMSGVVPERPRTVPTETPSDRVEPIPAAVVGPSIPVGKVVVGRPGFVFSPFTDQSKFVDVAGLTSGTTVRCPYSGKLFLVPTMGDTGVAPIGPEPDPTPAKPAGDAPMVLAAPKPKPEAPEPKSKPMAKSEPEINTEPEPAPNAEPGDATAEEKTTDHAVEDAGNAMPAPYAKRADSKPGYVVSPYGNFLVDVRGKRPDSVTRCPFTGKLFKVPAE